MTSSLVGAITSIPIDLPGIYNSLSLDKSRSSDGRRNASVFPVPVRARPTMETPEIAGPKVCACISVIFSSFIFSVKARFVAGCRSARSRKLVSDRRDESFNGWIRGGSSISDFVFDSVGREGLTLPGLLVDEDVVSSP
jgi:hypothetical protein